MRVAAGVEGADVLGDVHLVHCDHHLRAPLQFVLEPGVGHSQVEVAGDFDRWVGPQEDLPMVVHGLEDWREVDVELREILETH